MTHNTFRAKVISQDSKRTIHILNDSFLRMFLKDIPIGDSVVVTIRKEKRVRTFSQNSAMWLFFEWLADSLNSAGLDMRVVLKPTYSIPWTKESVHDHLWLPVQRAMYGTDSTKELQKIGQIENIHGLLMRELGEKHQIEYIPWPVDEEKSYNLLKAN